MLNIIIKKKTLLDLLLDGCVLASIITSYARALCECVLSSGLTLIPLGGGGGGGHFGPLSFFSPCIYTDWNFTFKLHDFFSKVSRIL